MNKEFTLHQFGERNPVSILLPEPDIVPDNHFVGREQLLCHCSAAWLDVDGRGPLHFRLVGPPGVGKNEIVYYLAREVEKKPVFIIQGHEELAPEDIACTARITGDNRVEYVGSPLLAAMVTGGICFFDEIGKVPSRSLSLLASVLDERRTLTSVLAGVTVQAAPGFRFCAAMNDADFNAYGLPDYIDDRLRPAFQVGHPDPEETIEIVARHAAHHGAELLESFRDWIADKEPMSPRQALKIIGFAGRIHQVDGGTRMTQEDAERLFQQAAENCLMTP